MENLKHSTPSEEQFTIKKRDLTTIEVFKGTRDAIRAKAKANKQSMKAYLDETYTC